MLNRRKIGLHLLWLVLLSWLLMGRAEAQYKHHMPWLGYPLPPCRTGAVFCNLTRTPEWETFHSWSPDGKKLALVRYATTPETVADEGIYVINADGTGLVKLSDDGYAPTWSPDGKKIAYSFNHIYVMNADGSNVTALRGQDLNEGRTPVWSPDGSKIAYHSFTQIDLCCDIAPDLYVMNADGSHQIKLASDVAIALPTWSPDSSKIAVSVYRVETPFDINVINADGSGMTNLTNSPAFDVGAAWSPDGRKIAFFSSENGRASLYMMDADGSNIVKVTNRTFRADVYAVPCWSPDGSKILFQSTSESAEISMALYLVNPAADQTPQRIYSTTDQFGGNFGWSPDSSKIAIDTGDDVYILGVE